MLNPRDWFRRRRSAFDEEPAEIPDDAVLDLGVKATLLRDQPGRSDATATERRPVPPPRPAVRHRDGVTLDRSAFAIRPELLRRSAGPAAPRVAGNGAALAAFTLRRGSGTPAAALTREAESAPALDEPGPLAAARPRRETEDESVEHAQFHLTVPGISWKRGRTVLADAEQFGGRLRDAFTPTRPKHDAALFSGRFKQLQRVIAAIEEERAHVVVYGERGSGKTSLANVLAGKAAEAGYFVLRFACSSDLSFSDIFRHFLRRMPATLLAEGVGAISRAGIDNFDQLLPKACGVPELIAVFERVHDRHVILIVDEYDRIDAEETKARFAELIKNMSDASAPVTLLIVGVADNVRELLGKHPSLQRTLVTVPMPLMSRREIDGIIGAGEEKSGLSFDPWVRETIVDFAQGLPYHAQLLSLFAARNALRRRSNRIERADLRYAVERAAEEAEPRVKEAYDLAVGPQENASFRDVLFHAARCRTDEFGMFSAADVVAAAAPAQAGVDGQSLLALQYPLKKLTEPERGAMLRRALGPDGLRYQFATQMMRHHVLMRQAVQRELV
jgi:Cdc6-like AAA superfamily ATPase